MPALRIFRIFRVVRAVRIYRQLGGKRVFRELRSQLASGTLYFVIFILVTVLEFVGLLELYFEEDAPGANITTAGDALWWGYVTATTVGYGDQYPVTTGGRISGLIMLTVGVALFATFSGFLATTFLAPRKPKPAETRPELADTVWIAHGARDLPLALAHELVHLLSDSGEHSSAPGNLMLPETSPANVRLSGAQCERRNERLRFRRRRCCIDVVHQHSQRTQHGDLDRHKSRL